MKKLTIALLILFGATSFASAEYVRVGVSGQAGAFYAKGSDANAPGAKITSDTTAAVGYSSVFVEANFGTLHESLSRLSIGYDIMPSSLTTDTTENVRLNSSTYGTVTNSLKLEFSDLETMYVAVKLTDNFYVKAGTLSVDVATKEVLATGSTYGDTSLDGTMFGVGYDYTMDNGLFARVETSVLDFDGVTMTSGDNTVSLDTLSGATAKLSVGFAF